MTTYIIRRLLFGVVLIFLSTIVSFTILRLSPGSPGGSFDPRVSQESIDQENAIFGDDLPPVKQYLIWLGLERFPKTGEFGGLLQGTFGKSRMFNQQPVEEVIKPRLWATLALNIVTLLLTWLVALPLGIYAAVHQHKWADRGLGVFSFGGMSMPGFFMALVILWLFASKVHWLPPGGLMDIDHKDMDFIHQMLDFGLHLVVPVIVLTFGALASLQRITRGNMLEVLRQQYITTARAKGLSENKVIYKHALRNAVNPLVTLLGFQFAALFGGAALLENVINYPGMGQMTLEALRAKDRALVMASFLLGSIMLVIGNLVAEVLLAWVDPRVTYE